MRHDDVNTLGTILYAAKTEDGSYTALYKNKECTELVTYEEAYTLIPKVSLVEVCEFSGNMNDRIYAKPMLITLGTSSSGSPVHEMVILAPQMHSGMITGFSQVTCKICKYVD